VEVEVKVLEKYCKGCGLCVVMCPKDKIFLKAKVNKQGINAADVRDNSECKACMQCVLVCPEACIEIKK